MVVVNSSPSQILFARPKLVLLLAIVFTIIVLFQYKGHIYPKFSYSTISPLSSSPNVLQRDGDEAIILFWTKYFGLSSSLSWNLTKIHKTFPNCFKACRIVADRLFLETSDAVIFHSRDLSGDDLPKIHRPDQPWIWLQQESPISTLVDLSQFRDTFNWTMTYRRDSEIFHPYYKISPRNLISPSASLNRSKLVSRSRLAAWIASNCHTSSKREEYVRQLQKYMSVDIFGKCGNRTCSSTSQNGCYSEIGHKYKFYLSFENSVCVDYVTEKFFLAMKHNMVPVVFGGANYKLVAPPSSFINVVDFNSTRELAEYLNFLDRTPEKYLEYLMWKLKYKVEFGDGWCSLCEKVRDYNRLLQVPLNTVQRRMYDLREWWDHVPESNGGDSDKPQPACHEPAELNLD